MKRGPEWGTAGVLQHKISDSAAVDAPQHRARRGAAVEEGEP